MYDPDTEKRATRVARQRASASPTGVGAAYLRDVTERGQDGWSGAVVVSDGEQNVVILVGAAGHNGSRGMRINEETLVRLVERRAGHFPRESRLEGLTAYAEKVRRIRLDTTYPEEWREVRRGRSSDVPVASTSG
jgi:hypothetical protein